MKLKKKISELGELIHHSEKTNKEVSERGVDWHIAHALKVVKGVYKALKKSNPQDYKWSFHPVRLIFLMNQSIPRGRGKAPKSTIPKEDALSQEDLQNQLQAVKELCKDIEKLPKNSHFQHPYFGKLHLRNSLIFLEIHTDHHIKIIQDILKN